MTDEWLKGLGLGAMGENPYILAPERRCRPSGLTPSLTEAQELYTKFFSSDPSDIKSFKIIIKSQ